MEKVSFTTRVMASVCCVCPFCILHRLFPKSLYARVIKSVEKNCPFCNAYDKLHKMKKQGTKTEFTQEKS